MPYFNNTPLATEQIAATQPKILANFQYLQNSLNLNHTFNGNAIGSEAAGSHQKLDMPNQAIDITALPTGIAAVMYAIGGNIFSWNGAKRPVSGITTSNSSVAISTTSTTVLVLPNDGLVANDCIGCLFVTLSNGGNINPCFFMAMGGNVYIDNPTSGGSAGYGVSGFNIQYRRATIGSDYNGQVKSILWPV